MKTNINLWSYPAQFLVEWEMLQTKVVEEIKAYSLCSIIFVNENLAVYEKVENILEPDSPRMTTGHNRPACWVANAANIHWEYVILIAFPLQQWFHERASVLCYAYIACLFKNNLYQMGNEVCCYYFLPPSNLRIEGHKPFTMFRIIKLILPSPCGFHHISVPFYVSQIHGCKSDIVKPS